MIKCTKRYSYQSCRSRKHLYIQDNFLSLRAWRARSPLYRWGSISIDTCATMLSIVHLFEVRTGKRCPHLLSLSPSLASPTTKRSDHHVRKHNRIAEGINGKTTLCPCWDTDQTKIGWSNLTKNHCNLIPNDFRAKKSAQTLLYTVFRELFGSWTAAPKIVDVRTKKCVFLRPQWWGETFWALGIRGVRVRMSAGYPDRKVYVYVDYLPWMLEPPLGPRGTQFCISVARLCQMCVAETSSGTSCSCCDSADGVSLQSVGGHMSQLIAWLGGASYNRN